MNLIIVMKVMKIQEYGKQKLVFVFFDETGPIQKKKNINVFRDAVYSMYNPARKYRIDDKELTVKAPSGMGDKRTLLSFDGEKNWDKIFEKMINDSKEAKRYFNILYNVKQESSEIGKVFLELKELEMLELDSRRYASSPAWQNGNDKEKFAYIVYIAGKSIEHGQTVDFLKKELNLGKTVHASDSGQVKVPSKRKFKSKGLIVNKFM